MTSKEIVKKSEKLKKSITELKEELKSIRIKINSLHLSQSNLVKGSPEERKLFETEDAVGGIQDELWDINMKLV